MHHPAVVRCTGDSKTCPVPHNRWLIESGRTGGAVPVRGLPVPAEALDLLNGRD